MIDWERVSELRAEVGVDDFREVVALFLDEVDEVIDRLRQTPDTEQLENDLHFLKGSALNLGFRALGDACASGEKLAALRRADEVDLGCVIKTYDSSKAEFVSLMQKERVAA